VQFTQGQDEPSSQISITVVILLLTTECTDKIRR